MQDYHRVDTVEDFIYNSENEQYNRDYLHWRRHTKKPWMFTFEDNSKEYSYTEGTSAVKRNAELAERQALMQCSFVIGAALLIYLVAEVVGGTVLITLMRLFRVDISMNFMSFSMSGSQWAVTGVRCFVIVLKFCVPTIMLIRLCKLPQQVVAPAAIGALPELIAAIGAGMLIAGIYSVTAIHSGVELSQRLFAYKDTAAIVAYGIFDVICTSILAEIFLRGTILPLLRQFGDPFAVLVTAIIGFLAPNAFPERCSELLIGLAASYVMIRCGSIFKTTLLRITYSSLAYARLVLVYSAESISVWRYVLILFGMGTAAVGLFVYIRRSELKLDNRQTFLPMARKLYYLTQSVPLLPWLAVSLLLMLL